MKDDFNLNINNNSCLYRTMKSIQIDLINQIVNFISPSNVFINL
jgi:hypothetical protein